MLDPHYSALMHALAIHTSGQDEAGVLGHSHSAGILEHELLDLVESLPIGVSTWEETSLLCITSIFTICGTRRCMLLHCTGCH